MISDINVDRLQEPSSTVPLQGMESLVKVNNCAHILVLYQISFVLLDFNRAG